ncbi:hypothetical protein GCM10009104_18170 [Marinobacterium maritimum]|uniref:Uncharacterized protein n=1 Tax=Marinobacterium maritimum TaxID=500162 RepID=A0ABP3T8V8_9GAMM
MKHLRKAFSNHRLIRSSPEGPLDSLSDQPAEQGTDMSAPPSHKSPATWQRRKPSFPTEPTETVPGLITLWDEIDGKNENKL